MPFFTPRGRAADVFRDSIFVFLQPVLPPAWFSGTGGIAVLHRPVSCCCSGSLHTGRKRDGRFPRLVREAVAALFNEESYPFAGSSRKMKFFATGKLTGL